ncbi:hypothetical protein FHS27_006521 [Rhodopirellula rubra]|uniref:Uncharacterized protein n=1 Tax=Aporhodopirellula rubra TaxID=980271 RepID=A0A7W5E6V7_9BACT|nr:hypothetical protein [Aporhodopirellula rubra]
MLALPNTTCPQRKHARIELKVNSIERLAPRQKGHHRTESAHNLRFRVMPHSHAIRIASSNPPQISSSFYT